MMRSIALASLAVLLLCEAATAQRTIGARRFQLDDGNGRTVRIDNRAGTVGIGINAATPDSSAILDLSSMSRGFLMPRMETPYRDMIFRPATGLMIYNNDHKTIEFNFGTPLAPLWDRVLTEQTIDIESLLVLPHNHMWVGDATNHPVAIPTVPGGILTADASGNPVWTPGLEGSGPGKYAGSVSIPMNAAFIDIGYAPIESGAAVTVSIQDIAGVWWLSPTVQSITPGVGFRVGFSADYPSATGKLNYIIVNP